MYSDFEKKIMEYCFEHKMFPRGKVLVALSGGGDSVALLHLLIKISDDFGISIEAAHLNHSLRGKESDKDESFCRDLCSSLNIPLTVERLKAGEISLNEGSIETAAREARMAFLKRAAMRGNIIRIATGHTLDDQAETILQRMIRGTGPTGLTGILPVRENLWVRPVLCAYREEVRNYLDRMGISYREDSTNQDTSFFRNRIRHELLPLLRERFSPNITSVLSRMSELARIQEDYSYDFAAGLMNALGLNGAKIQNEKDRLAAFKEYREKIQSVIDSIAQLDRTIQELGQKPQLFLDKDKIQDELSEIKVIKWNELQIDNPMQFSKIEHFEDQKSRITIALDLITKLQEALKDYEDFHNSIIYMDNALEALDKNDILVTNLDKLQALKDYLKDVKSITDNYELFIDKSQRNPIKGKIQQFTSIYAYDFYIPAHDRYVGKKLNWQNLDSYHENETFKKLALLNKLTCLSNVKFNQMVTDWEELRGLRCSNNTLEENLKSSVKCQRCSFPEVRDFLTLPKKLENIEEDIEALYESQEKIVLREIRTYENNVQFLDSEDEKELIDDIQREQKLWDYISLDNIRTINKLFKEIDVVEVDRDEIIDTLFPNQEMVQMEEIRKRFYDLEAKWKKNKQESEIRLKLK